MLPGEHHKAVFTPDPVQRGAARHRSNQTRWKSCGCSHQIRFHCNMPPYSETCRTINRGTNETSPIVHVVNFVCMTWEITIVTTSFNKTVTDIRLRPRCRHLANLTKQHRARFWPIWFNYVKTLRHPQNRKYILLSEEDRVTATCKIWICGFWDMRADRHTDRQKKDNTQTHRHDDRNNLLTYWRRSITVVLHWHSLITGWHT